MVSKLTSKVRVMASFAEAYLTLPASCISESCIKMKINLNFYFHTSLWCLKSFYEGLKSLHKKSLHKTF